MLIRVKSIFNVNDMQSLTFNSNGIRGHGIKPAAIFKKPQLVFFLK